MAVATSWQRTTATDDSDFTAGILTAMLQRMPFSPMPSRRIKRIPQRAPIGCAGAPPDLLKQGKTPGGSAPGRRFPVYKKDHPISIHAGTGNRPFGHGRGPGREASRTGSPRSSPGLSPDHTHLINLMY